MKDELYKKVFIHSEEDLPEVKDNYVIKEKLRVYPTNYTFDPLSEYDKKTLLSIVNWYLQPISQPELSNDKTIIEKMEELIAYYDLEYCPLASKSITFRLIEKGKNKLKRELSSLKDKSNN
ncbi:MAG: hypothetical protein UR43_C0019G0014 [candidate division TM6 bacterium GW2011_GWF2_33_332]|nr:MAG: hypothetical protein UR43_C0019G0014 [candidate division TM6 bacterium GW2011_GWF2_33_332]